MIVLDASALLAFMFREQGHEQVAQHIDDCCLSTVNLSEVIARFVRDGHHAHEVWQRIAETNIEIVPFSASQAIRAASLQPQTKTLGLSLADRACLSLAAERQIPVLTADQVWQAFPGNIEITVIR